MALVDVLDRLEGDVADRLIAGRDAHRVDLVAHGLRAPFIGELGERLDCLDLHFLLGLL